MRIIKKIRVLAFTLIGLIGLNAHADIIEKTSIIVSNGNNTIKICTNGNIYVNNGNMYVQGNIVSTNLASQFDSAGTGAIVQTNLNNEIIRATNAELVISNVLNNSINNEISRATNAEINISNLTVAVNNIATNTYVIATNAQYVAVNKCIGGARNSYYWYLTYADLYTNGSALYMTTNGDQYSQVYTPLIGGFVNEQFNFNVLRGLLPSPVVTWAVSPTNYGNINQGGLLTVTGVGTVTISVQNDNTQIKNLTILTKTNVSVAPFTLWTSNAVGSVRNAATTNVEMRITGGTNIWPRSYWSTFVISSNIGSFVKNTNCWAYGADLSGVSVHTGPTNSGQGVYWHGTLITPDHIAMAKHAFDPVGTIKWFVGRSGAVYERTITKLEDPWPGQPYVLGGADTMIGVLSSPLPTNDVAYYPVFTNSIRSLYNGFVGIPAIIYDQNLNINIGDFDSGNKMVDGYATVPIDNEIKQSTDSLRLQFWSAPYSGDSGRPVFMWLPNQLVLIFTMSYSAGGAPFMENGTAINAVLTNDNQVLTPVNLSGYLTY